ncbi:phiSA1p31-related protein [Streptomyces sp. NPDC056517]|uniref:phiSA1p31-related protein n=1 Tax=Streptomyces sp. NPDC056517 TaxID=3345848 RepID=UPI0036916F26
MTKPEPAIRMIDLNEQLLVVTLDRSGVMRTSVRGMCNDMAASVLRGLAEQLEADHPPFPCDWDEQRDAPAPAYRPAEPLPSEGARLDRAAKVWTDGAGHAWDLSVPWEDSTSLQWVWSKRMDTSGVPIMKTTSYGKTITEPLDVLRAAAGPLKPVAGEQR